MNRDRSYYHKMRAKHIRRKKRLACLNFGNGWGYKHDGMYSKGKIHCSCPMCSRKTNNKGKNRLKHGNYYPSKDWKHSDLQKIQKMEDELKEYMMQ